MKAGRGSIFPALMLAVMMVSVVLIVTSLQAAAVTVSESAVPAVSAKTIAGGLTAQGRALFLAKGCIVCHRHESFASMRSGMLDFDDVPDLTNLRIDRGYLTSWLRNPKALKPGTAMPNLALSETEIEALADFLTDDKN